MVVEQGSGGRYEMKRGSEGGEGWGRRDGESDVSRGEVLKRHVLMYLLVGVKSSRRSQVLGMQVEWSRARSCRMRWRGPMSEVLNAEIRRANTTKD